MRDQVSLAPPAARAPWSSIGRFVESPQGRRALRIAYWTAPSLFCLWLYWYGLRCWFQQDDFAWLQLRQSIGSWADAWHYIFGHSRHGTFRPLSERCYFFVFSWIFGLHAFPFRALVFLTQFANLALIASIASRLTGSRAAGFWAPLFWLLNSALVVPMAWSSSYMQVLCGFCLLLAFHFFLRYIETGRVRYYRLQWIPFLAGFLVLETTIIYPAIAAAFALICARKFFRSTLPLFVPSAVFGVLHMVLAPKAQSGTYSLHLDAGVLKSIAVYWKWAFEPQGLYLASRSGRWALQALVIAAMLAVAAALVWAVRRRQFVAVFFAAWYLIVLAPVLPLREHLTSYYQALPTIGLAMLMAYALTAAWRAGLVMRAVAAIVLAGFVLCSVRAVRAHTWWWFNRSQRVEILARGVSRARALHPQDTILLTGVDNTLFWGAIYDGVFPAMEVSGVFLAPGSEAYIEAHPEMTDVARYIMQPALVYNALRADRIVVYDVAGTRMRAITQAYRKEWDGSAVSAPSRLDVGSAVVDGFLGPTWLAGEGTHRWMPKSATVRLAAPRASGQQLYIKGYCPKAQIASGPLGIRVSVNGNVIANVRITRGDEMFEFALNMPAELVGKPSIEVMLEAERTIRHDGRELGLAMSLIEVR